MRIRRLRQPTKIQSAFTLIEVLVCLVIIAVFAGTVTVSLSGRNRTRALEMDARAVQGAIQYAVRESRLLQVAHRVQLLSNGTAFQILQQNPGGGETDFIPCAGLAGTVKSLNSGIRFLGTADRAELPLGASPDFLEFEGESQGFTGVVVIGFDEMDSKIIHVAPITRQVFIDP